MPGSTYKGKEVVPTDVYYGKVVVHDDHKETVTNPERETAYEENLLEPSNEERGKEVVPVATDTPVFQRPLLIKERLNRRICGIRAKWMLLGPALLILLIIVLGTSLGVSLRSG